MFMGNLVFVVAILSTAIFSLASIVRSEVLHFLFLCEYRGGGNLLRVVSLIC